MYLPNLLVIGAMKAGSTSLHNYLNLHPDVFMSEPKEINFFVEAMNYRNGLEWYKSHFPIASKFRGESSINYSKRHVLSGVPERIFNDLGGDVKFIYLVRNPVERFVSNYTDSKTYGHIPPNYNINKYVEDLDNNLLIKTSLYFYQISEYLKYFPKENFLFFKSDDLKNTPQKCMDQVFEFLGIEALSMNITKEYNTSKNKSYPSGLAHFIRNKTFISNMKAKISPLLINKVKGMPGVERLLRNKTGRQKDKLTEKNFFRLQEFMKDDILAFGKLSGLAVSDWLK